MLQKANKENEKLKSQSQYLSIDNWFLQNCINNTNVHKNHRHYTSNMLEFCEALYITSPKAYKLLKKVVNVPSISTLYNRFSNIVHEIKESLDDSEINKRLSFIHYNNWCDNIPVAVSVDATVASSIPCYSKQIKNIFLIQIQPLNGNYKNIPFSIIKSKSGVMNSEILTKIDSILNQMKGRFQIIFKCTDGDPGTNNWHIQKFNSIQRFLCLNLDQIIRYIVFDQWPISDFLHIIKNQRCRLFHPLSLTFDSEIISINDYYQIFKTKSFSDKSNLSKFNDKMALLVFSIKNVQILMNLQKDSLLYYLLPFAIWGAALRSKNLSIDSRMELLEIVKFIFYREYTQLMLNPDPNFCEKSSSNCQRITFYSKIKLKRIINTIIGIYYALKKFPNRLAINRISSHPIENTFGITRSIMQNKIGIDSFISSLTRNLFRTDLLNNLNIHLKQIRKVSYAGVCLTNKENETIHINVEKAKIELMHLRLSIQKQMNYQYKHTELEKIIDFLSKDKSLNLKETTQVSISGSAIASRNYACSNSKNKY